MGEEIAFKETGRLERRGSSQETTAVFILTMLQALLGPGYPWALAALALTVGGSVLLARWSREERQIQALGGHAPRVRTYLPLGSRDINQALKVQMLIRPRS